jgi:two-component system, chemotaxis family, chemotaxis protein CheY
MKDAVFLVVDDDGMVRDILTQYLHSFGYTDIIQAKDGKAAIKIVQNPNQKLDVIISDWEMPHVDGLTLLRAVRKDPTRASVKFLMVSSQSSHERMKISKAAKSHVDAYIVKPFRAHILKEKIETLLSGGVDQSSKEFEEAINKKVAGQAGDEASELPPEQYDLKSMNINLIISLDKAYKKVKWYDNSLKLCTEALTLFPNNADLLCQIGETYFMKSEFEEAMKYLKMATKQSPYHAGAHSLIIEINKVKQAV